MKTFKYNEKCDIKKLILFAPEHVEMHNFLIEYHNESGAEIIRNLIKEEFEKVQKKLKK